MADDGLSGFFRGVDGDWFRFNQATVLYRRNRLLCCNERDTVAICMLQSHNRIPTFTCDTIPFRNQLPRDLEEPIFRYN